MGSSLRDQLLKAGVASKQQAQKAVGEQRKKRRQKGAAGVVDEGKEQVRQAQSEKVVRDRELNRKTQEKAERKAVAAQIRQLIELNRLPREGGETPYSFVDGSKVVKIYVPERMHAHLARGLLSIVRLGDGYEVVPEVIAGKISERDTSVIIVRNPSDTLVDEDDPYAEHQVPDDLIW